MPNYIFKPKTTCGVLRRSFLKHHDGKEFLQKEVADDLGISEARWKQIEIGQSKLPEKHALKLQEIYGICACWLLAGNLKKKATSQNGGAYSQSIARHARAKYFSSPSIPNARDEQKIACSLFALLHNIRATVYRARWDTLDSVASSERLAMAADVFVDFRDALLPVFEKHGITSLNLLEDSKTAQGWDPISFEKIQSELTDDSPHPQ